MTKFLAHFDLLLCVAATSFIVGGVWGFLLLWYLG